MEEEGKKVQKAPTPMGKEFPTKAGTGKKCDVKNSGLSWGEVWTGRVRYSQRLSRDEAKRERGSQAARRFDTDL